MYYLILLYNIILRNIFWGMGTGAILGAFYCSLIFSLQETALKEVNVVEFLSIGSRIGIMLIFLLPGALVGIPMGMIMGLYNGIVVTIALCCLLITSVSAQVSIRFTKYLSIVASMIGSYLLIERIGLFELNLKQGIVLAIPILTSIGALYTYHRLEPWYIAAAYHFKLTNLTMSH